MRILIADDHPIVRHGLKQMLAADPAATVVGEATNGDEALEMARKLEWDMAIFDFSMPGRSGLDLLGDIKREFPTRPVLILSMHSEDVHGSRVLRAGGSGYITKDSAPTELTTAVRKVANGGKYVSASLAEILASECSSDPQKALHEKLSDREYRVMWLLATGKQISRLAHLAVHLVGDGRGDAALQVGGHAVPGLSPLCGDLLQNRMGYKAMPYDGLERLGVRRDARRVDRRDHDHAI